MILRHLLGWHFQFNIYTFNLEGEELPCRVKKNGGWGGGWRALEGVYVLSQGTLTTKGKLELPSHLLCEAHSSRRVLACKPHFQPL